MAAASWFRCFYLARLARPKSSRELYRLVKRHRICRVVEIGISDLGRATSLLEVAQRYARSQPVHYTAIDWFDARPSGLSPLSLKDAYRTLRSTGANVRLVPGAPAATLAATANTLQATDLIQVAPHVTDEELRGAWFYVPRMLHERSTILREQRGFDGQPLFARITPAEVADRPRDTPARRAA